MNERRLNILLVENDESLYFLIRDLLAQSRTPTVDLEWVTTYDAAVEEIKLDRHDVYLINHRLEGRDAATLLPAAGENPGRRAVILLIDEEGLEPEEATIQSGVTDYLVKGQFDGPMLRRTLRYAVERQRAAEALRASEERYALAARGSNDGLWDWNLTTGEISFSPRWKAMLGYAESEISNHPDEWFERVHPDDMDELQAEIALYIESRAPRFEREYRLLHKDGHYRWMISRGITVQDEWGQTARMAGSQTDISDRKVAEEELLHSAFYDALTGLPNRALFMDRLGRATAHGKRRDDYSFAVLCLDLDQFKVINDSLGHASGDQLLIEVARRLSPCMRQSDTLARLGGDEFTILMEDIDDPSDVSRLAERIHKKLAAPFRVNGEKAFISAGIGITLSSSGYESAEAILRDADTAMHRAKTQGRAGSEIFDAAMHAEAVRRLQLETDLRRAVEQQEFRLQYQPIVSLETGRVTGFEALVRWQHPQRGLLLPGEFLPLAEEMGLIVSIDRWVLNQACHEMRLWRSSCGDMPLTLSVNLSGRHFTQPSLPTLIEGILAASGLEAHHLILEITEGAIMEHSAAATVTLATLRGMGVKLCMDDFGTGYSSLSFLHRFPINILKIDPCFISRMDTEREIREIVRTVVTLAHNLGMDVVAEGVETPEQLARLQEFGCEYGQGHLLSMPMQSHAAGRMLAQESPSPESWKPKAPASTPRKSPRKPRGLVSAA